MLAGDTIAKKEAKKLSARTLNCWQRKKSDHFDAVYITCTCVFCQIWSVLSGAQVYVSRDGNIGVTKLSFLLGR